LTEKNTLKLVLEINKAQPEPSPLSRVEAQFSKWWPDLAIKLEKAKSDFPDDDTEKTEPPDVPSMLIEILELVRQQARSGYPNMGGNSLAAYNLPRYSGPLFGSNIPGTLGSLMGTGGGVLGKVGEILKQPTAYATVALREPPSSSLKGDIDRVFSPLLTLGPVTIQDVAGGLHIEWPASSGNPRPDQVEQILRDVLRLDVTNVGVRG
jgi:hypothetical protein